MGLLFRGTGRWIITIIQTQKQEAGTVSTSIYCTPIFPFVKTKDAHDKCLMIQLERQDTTT